MQKKFLRNLVFLILLNLLIKPFWIFGIDRTVQNMTGNSDYGLYFAMLNFSFLFYMVLDFGLVNFNNRAISRDAQLLETYLPNILAIKIFLGFAYLGVTFIAAALAGFDHRAMHFLFIMTINQFIISMILYLRSNISALQHFIVDSILSVLDRFLMILICAAILWLNVLNRPFEIEFFIYAQTAALLVSLIIVLAVVRAKATMPRLKFDLAFSLSLLRQTFPFALLGVLMSIYNRIDAVMIERMLGNRGDEQAGIYAQGFRLFDAANMFGFLFASLLLPMFAKMLSEKKKIEDLLVLSFETIMVFGCSLAVVCFFYRQPIMNALYTSGEHSANIFGLLMISFVGVSMMYVFGSLLTAHGSMRQLNQIALSGVVLNIGLNIYLIPRYEALGATIATLITQGLVALAHVAVAKKIFSLKSNFSLITRILLFILLSVFISYSTTLLAFDWKIKFVLAGIACIVSAILFRLLNMRQMAGLIRSESAAGDTR